MIYLLLAISVLFLLLNLKLAHGDYFHPSVIFCAVFTASELLCVFFQKSYAITIYPVTVIVLSCGFAIFTLIHWLYARKISREPVQYKPLKKIEISSWLIYPLIAAQIVAVVAFVVYLRRLSFAYDGEARSLSEMINLYDTMTKFWQKQFLKLAVPVPMPYRVLNPFVHAGGYICVYAFVHNWVAERKIDWRCLISVGMLCVLIFLNGSRSPLLRVLTMVLILYYILGYRNGVFKRGDGKVFLKTAAFVIPAIVVLVLMVKIMRPGVKIADLGDYVFIYAGAPVVNLNNWLIKASGKAHLTRIGGQTFRYMYNYLGKWTGNKKMQTYASINKFAFSANKKEIGNVYTCYYLLIYDFSYIGAVVMTVVMAWYYTHQYSRFVTAQKLFRFDPQLYIYAYLFNDLVMSFFSARFYETTVNPDFIKFVFASFIIYWIWRFSLKIQKKKVLQGKE